MASNIISDTIDATYPVAGVDNDTQGFRDNFSIIKTGLNTANSEISTLQSTTAKLNASNDFNGTNIADANMQLQTSQYHNVGTVVAGQNISFLNGHYQTMTVNLPVGTDTISFALSDWPARQQYAEMVVAILGNDTAKTATFTVSGGGTIKYDTNYPRVSGAGSTPQLTIDSSANPLLVKFWTYTQGTTVFAQYLGQYT
jgi:hypothetical protein